MQIDDTKNVTGNQPLNGTTSRLASSPPTAEASDFRMQLQTQLEQQGRTLFREKDIFAALIAQQLGSLKGAETLTAFQQHFDAFLAEKRGQGIQGLVYAANRALKKVRVSGLISRDEAHEIRSRAFGAAQMDFNPYRLGRDWSKRQEKYEINEVLDKAEAKMARFQSGEERALRRAERRQALSLYNTENDSGTINVARNGRRKHTKRLA